MNLPTHPTVIAYRAGHKDSNAPVVLDAANLKKRCLAAGAHDVGLVELTNPAIADQREIILAAFPRTEALISFAIRMNREDVRPRPARRNRPVSRKSGALLNRRR